MELEGIGMTEQEQLLECALFNLLDPQIVPREVSGGG